MELKEIRKEFFTENESLRKVEEIRQDILKRGITSIQENELADAVLTLAMYMVNIGQLFVDLGAIADDDDEMHKAAVEEKYMAIKEKSIEDGEKLSDKNAESKARLACKGWVAKAKESRDKYNFIMRYYKDTERIISTAQSKMRVGASDMVRSKAT